MLRLQEFSCKWWIMHFNNLSILWKRMIIQNVADATEIMKFQVIEKQTLLLTFNFDGWLFCRIHWRSEIMYWRSGLPTVCIWSLECASWRPIRIGLKALPGCRGYQETQGIEGRSARSRQLLGQTINVTFLALEDRFIKRTVSVLTFVNYLLCKKSKLKIAMKIVLQVQN